MKNNVPYSLAAIVLAIIFTGCSHEPPKCGDDETISIVTGIFAQNLEKTLNSLNTIDRNGSKLIYGISDVTEKEIQSNLKISHPRANAFDEKIKKYECAASLDVGESHDNPITYSSQLDDKNEHLVYVNRINDYVFSLMPNLIQEIKRTRESARSAPRASLPSHTEAMQDLFGIEVTEERVKTGVDEISSVWFEQSFKQKGENLHVVFVKTQVLDESGKIETCHTCGVNVSSITYKKISGLWEIISKQIKFGKTGTYGDAPETKQAVILQLSTNQIAFLTDYSYGQGGFEGGGKILFIYSNKLWRDVGFIMTYANNTGQCDKAPSPAGEKKMGICWGYTGTISTQDNKDANYPKLLVTQTGTELAEKVTLIPAKNVNYIFDGNSYVESKVNKQHLSISNAANLTASLEEKNPEIKRISDYTNTLTQDEISALEKNLINFDNSGKHQTAILVVTTTYPESIAEYSNRIANFWKLGDSTNNGLLIVVAKDDGRVRIEAGDGLSSIFTNEVLQKIIAETLAPNLKAQKFSQAFVATLNQLSSVFDNSQ